MEHPEKFTDISLVNWPQLDYINGSTNKCGVKSMELIIDSTLEYSFTLDHFSYYEKRYINN